MRQPKAIDLFSGCGGLTLGLTQAGFRVVGAVENDSLAVETYKANHKRVVIWERDIHKLTAAEVMSRLKIELDLLAGCPPCQGFSTMTTLNVRIGQDEQNDLVFEFLRFVRVLRPFALRFRSSRR